MCAVMAVVVVLPWVPATAMVKWFFEISPKATARLVMTRPRRRISAISFRSLGTAGV